MSPPLPSAPVATGLSAKREGVEPQIELLPTAELTQQIHRLAEIGIALSAERDLGSLLERILTEARRFTHADAGTIYMLRDDGLLHFEVLHNDTFASRRGGASGQPIPAGLKPVTPGLHHVSGYAALKGETVNIPDVYEAEGFDFSGTREYDRNSGYRSQSMLVVPMMDHEATVIGVLQLINAKTAAGEVVPFSSDLAQLAESLASQAAVALANARLIENLKALFESLIRVMAKAVDRKDPTTAGHIERVTTLSVALAAAVNETEQGELADIAFTPDDLEELRIAGWLHDIGKLVTPDRIMNKSKKLEALFDRIKLLRARFKEIKAMRRVAGLEEKARLLERGAAPEEIASCERRVDNDLRQLEEELEFIALCNEPGEFMHDSRLERLREIGSKTYQDADGEERPYLTADELTNLSIRRGSFTQEDFQLMRDHVSVTSELLDLVPFTRKLQRVPLYAGQHHELLDGSGYPNRLTAEDLPLLSRILTVCDIFDALSAKDRPYKKAFNLETCLKKLREEMSGKLDSRLVDLFIQKRIWETVGLHTDD